MTSTTMTATADARPATRRPLLRRLFADSAYLFLSFPIALASFTVLVTGLSLGAGLMITLLGLPVLLATLYVARGFAAVERMRLRWVTGAPVTAARYRTRNGSGLRAWFRRFADRQMWLDVLHGLLIFPIATVTWSIAVSWWAVALYGLPWSLYGHALDRASDVDSRDLPQLLGIDTYTHRALFYAGVSVFALLTLPFIIRGLTHINVAVSRVLLTNSRIAALQERVETLTASRDATAQAEATSLRRLERDLHDGPQQRLTRIAMDLGMVQRKLETDPEAARSMLDEALDQTRETIAEMRALSRGIAPPILADRGLAAALAAVAARATVQVDLDVRLEDGERLPPAVENAAYFVVAEALTNVAKHADATTCAVVVRRDNGNVRLEISDNGRGGAHVSKGHGLAGLDERVTGLGGTLTITSPDNGPTHIVAVVPCA